jgi:hypothetical protein
MHVTPHRASGSYIPTAQVVTAAVPPLPSQVDGQKSPTRSLAPLAEFLQVEPVPGRLHPAAFGCTIRLVDQVVAIVDDLTGNAGTSRSACGRVRAVHQQA